MTEPKKMSIRITSWNDPSAQHLRSLQRQEIASEHNRKPGIEPSENDIQLFIVVEVDGAPVACAGFKTLSLTPDDKGPAVEVKRMFVLPSHRGEDKGVTSALMEAVELEAVRKGWKVLKLGTGEGMWRARKFYEKHGFRQVALWDPYIDAPDSVCYEKVI